MFSTGSNQLPTEPRHVPWLGTIQSTMRNWSGSKRGLYWIATWSLHCRPGSRLVRNTYSEGFHSGAHTSGFHQVQPCPLKPRTDEQVFFTTFYLLVCTGKIDNFSLPKSLVPKLVMLSFGRGKFRFACTKPPRKICQVYKKCLNTEKIHDY
jgi:hypothetical protein